MEAFKNKRLTMSDVALKAGVSITTVSHVINKTRYVSRETMETVLDAIKALNYQSEKFLKSRAGPEIYVGVIVADIRQDYFITMIKTIETVAADYGVSVIFCDSEEDAQKEVKNITMLLERNVNGLIICPIEVSRFPQILKTASVPVVLIDRQYESHSCLFVGINNFHSSYLATKYLFGKSASKIGFISYSRSIYTVDQRILGYKAALVELGRNVQPRVLALHFEREDSSPKIRQFVHDEKLDGLICGTSTVCCEVINALEEYSHDTLERLKIITFDDNQWMDHLKIPVSVIVQPVAEIGNAALENLLRMIENTNSDRNIKRELLFDVNIIDRIKQ
jgi:DNA-binding LacI/PurR family transcriptional regulator